MACDVRWVLLAAAGALAGCAGNGEGLDPNGRPVTAGSSTPLTPDLQSIQDHVFTPICTQCHVGAAAPLGFRLDADSAYAMLVNAPSVEVPALNRVTPGDPDASYLIAKLEGRAAVGAQMPLGQPPLPAETIAAIRQWIANGAPRGAAAEPTVMPMQVRAIEPESGQLLSAPPREILLQAAGELDVSTLSAASAVLVRSGGDGTFDDGNEVRIQTAHIEVRSLQPTVFSLSLPGGALVPDAYRLTLSGSVLTPSGPAGAPVRDRSGLAIGTLVLPFSVEAAP